MGGTGSATERLNRNWDDLLQELRVAQTGVQLLTGLLLTGLLLTVPFQARFDALVAHQRVVFLVAISLSATATALLIAPVVLHRAGPLAGIGADDGAGAQAGPQRAGSKAAVPTA